MASLGALLATSKPGERSRYYEGTYRPPRIEFELSPGAPQAVFEVDVEQTGPTPQGELLSAVDVEVAAEFEPAGSGTSWTIARTEYLEPAQSSPPAVGVLTSYKHAFQTRFVGNCSLPLDPDDPCRARFQIEFVREQSEPLNSAQGYLDITFRARSSTPEPPNQAFEPALKVQVVGP